MSIFALKLVAIISMFIDHFGVTFAPVLGECTEFFRAAGRIAFPLFVFMAAEGCRYTRNIYHYALRLGAFALITEPVFDMWHETVRRFPEAAPAFVNTDSQNVFFTLCLGVCAVAWLRRFGRMAVPTAGSLTLCFLGVAACMAAGWALGADYGALGVLAIVLCYAAPDKPIRIAVLAVLVVTLYYGYTAYNAMLIAGGLSSLAFVALYNGKRGMDKGFVKWSFYIFYPAHMLLLFAMYEVYVRYLL